MPSLKAKEKSTWAELIVKPKKAESGITRHLDAPTGIFTFIGCFNTLTFEAIKKEVYFHCIGFVISIPAEILSSI